MPDNPSANYFREHLFGDADFEMAGSDHATGVGYRITVRRGEIDVAAFSGIAPEVLESSIKSGLPLSIGSTLYHIDRSFEATFCRAVYHATRVRAVSVTLQSHHQIVTFIGGDPATLADAIEAYVPRTLEWARDTFVEGSREWGRKVGHAAKDIAGLRKATFGLEYLEILERSGEAEAYEAVHKQALLPVPTLDSLRATGVPPTVAFGIVSCWRMFRQRPSRHPAFRLMYVRLLPPFFADLQRSHTLDDFTQVIMSLVERLAKNAAAVAGTRLPSFAERLGSPYRDVWPHRDTVLRNLLALNALSDAKRQWAFAAQALSNRNHKCKPFGLPLPIRQPVPLQQLKRSGLNLPDTPQIARMSDELGITGLELGNYVSGREGEYLMKLFVEALVDLYSLVGDWVIPLCRRGNLSVAIGARGKGRNCAHYEPGLRVINLTKLRGDGSLAHEFGHFLDHILASYAPTGESRYLSARVSHLPLDSHPIAFAMQQVMRVISIVPCRERVTGETAPRRWYLRPWIAARGYDPALPPQASFDRITDREPNRFRTGRHPRSNSITLVHSLAKFGKRPVEVEIAYDTSSNYLQQAKMLGAYWSRPQELFARGFESFVEDALAGQAWRSDYLVFGTQRDYTRYRGRPYPTGAERERIGKAIKDLLGACAHEGSNETS